MTLAAASTAVPPWTRTHEPTVFTIRKFVDERLIPLEAQVSENDEIPAEVIPRNARAWLSWLTNTQEYGGIGLNTYEECKVVMELGRASPAFRSIFGTNNGIGSQGIVMDGTGEQRAYYLPKLASGEIIGSFALAVQCWLRCWRITNRRLKTAMTIWYFGTKRYITNAPSAQLFTVFARTDPDQAGAKGVSAFLVDANTPGITLSQPYRKMGQQGAHVCDVIFEDCRVPASQMVGGIDNLHKGFQTAMKTSDRGRIHISALSVGCANRLIDLCLSYGQERSQFGQPIGEFQLLQGMIADSKAESYAAQCMVLDTAQRRDGENVNTLASCCKLFATEMVGRVADRAVQYHGGAGYIEEYAVARFYRDVRLFRIYEGTSQIQQGIIARNLMKAAKS